MRNKITHFIIVVIVIIYSFLLFSNCLWFQFVDPFAYSTLLLASNIEHQNHIVPEKLIGDEWRYHAKTTLDHIRVAPSIIIVVLSLISSINKALLVVLPLPLLIIVLCSILIIKKLVKFNNSILIQLFYVSCVLLIQPMGFWYIPLGFAFLFLIIYISVSQNIRSIKSFLIIIILLVSASFTYYTAFTLSLIFVFVCFSFEHILSFVNKVYKHTFTLQKSNALYIVLISLVYTLLLTVFFDPLLNKIFQEISIEKIYHAFENAITLKFMLSSSKTILTKNNYATESPPNKIFVLAHSASRILIGTLSIVSFILAIWKIRKGNSINLNLFRVLVSLIVIGIVETTLYSIIGGVLLVRILFSVCLPLLILFCSVKLNINRNKVQNYVFILLFALLIITNSIRNISYINPYIEYNYAHGRYVINEIGSYIRNEKIIITSIFLSSYTSFFTYDHNVPLYATSSYIKTIIEFGPKALLNKEERMLIFIPQKYPYIRAIGWSSDFKLKSLFFNEFHRYFHLIYNDGIFQMGIPK